MDLSPWRQPLADPLLVKSAGLGEPTSRGREPMVGGGWGGGTHPGFGYPLQNGQRELWLSVLSSLEKEGLSLTQVLSEEGL